MNYGILSGPPQGVLNGFASNGGGAAFGNPAMTMQGEQYRERLKQLLEYLRLQQQYPGGTTAAVRG